VGVSIIRGFYVFAGGGVFLKPNPCKKQGMSVKVTKKLSSTFV
jgi:hypothetical protein